MGMIVVGLVRDVHKARGLVRALEDDGFELEDLDVSAGLLTELVSRGVPQREADVLAEAVRRGGMLVFVRAEDDDEAVEAAETMAEHGVVDLDAHENDAPGRIYHDPRSYNGPERRKSEEQYAGTDRRAI